MTDWFTKTLFPHLVTHWPLSISTGLYITEAFICYSKDKLGQMIMFIGYTLGNLGILWSLFG